jgi:hypothetical protein
MRTSLHAAWNRILIAIFVAAIVVPGAGTLLHLDHERPTGEKRDLAAFPDLHATWTSLRAFPDGFTRYFEDNFAFRTRLVRWQAAIRLDALHVSPSPAVVAGRDGWLFYADDGAMQDYVDEKPFTHEELEAWRTTLQHTQDWLRGRGIKYVFVIAPDKHVIYPEMFPASVRRLHDESRMDELVSYLRSYSTVNVLDLRPALLAARAHERLYHRTDTHWNDRGAFVGYQQIVARLGLQPMPRQAFQARDVTTNGRDLAGMLGLTDVLSENDLRLTEIGGRRARIVEPAHPNEFYEDARIVTEQANTRLPRAVVFRDSFASSLVPFLSEHFSRAVYLWQNNFDPAVIEQEHPGVVIQEWVGRHLTNQWPYDGVADLPVPHHPEVTRAASTPPKPTRTVRARG